MGEYEYCYRRPFGRNHELKSESGKDIIVYGGATFDSSLIKAGLIDEFHLLINPAAIGSGMAIFKDISEIQKFTMIKSTPFDCGIVDFIMSQREIERYVIERMDGWI